MQRYHAALEALCSASREVSQRYSECVHAFSPYADVQCPTCLALEAYACCAPPVMEEILLHPNSEVNLGSSRNCY